MLIPKQKNGPNHVGQMGKGRFPGAEEGLLLLSVTLHVLLPKWLICVAETDQVTETELVLYRWTKQLHHSSEQFGFFLN